MTEADMQHAHEPERHVGFTGTRNGGMTTAQAVGVAVRFRDFGWLHHGDCVGADRHANILARASGLKIETHPPDNPVFRAFCDADTANDLKPYLVRNRDIVDATERLIAAPGEMTEQQRSGTWQTVRYARRVGKPVTIVFPDGSVRDE